MRLFFSVGLLVACLASFGCDRIEALKEDLLGTPKTTSGENPDLVALRDVYASGEYQAALSRAEALAAANPGLAEAYYYQGLCHLARAGEPDAKGPLSEEEQASLDAFARALSINPRHALSNIGIGDLYSRRFTSRRRRGKSDDPEDPYTLAREAYEKAVAIDPRLPEAQSHYAAFLVRTGEIEAAEQAYKAAADAAATVPEIAPDYYIAYGRFLAGPADRLDEAIDQYELAQMYRRDDVTIQQDMAIAYSRIGLRHLDKQEYLLAEEALKKAEEMFPDASIPEAQKVAEALAKLRSIRRR